MIHRLLLTLFVVGLGTLTATAQDNPFKRVVVGDYAEYKMVTKVGDTVIEATSRMTITEKTDKKAKMTTVSIVNGMELPSGETEIDLTMPYDPIKNTTGKQKTDVQMEKLKEGKEKIKVGMKEYDCTFVKSRVLSKAKGGELDSEVTIWMAKDAPLTGMVKMETTSKTFTVTMELTRSGSAKK